MKKLFAVVLTLALMLTAFAAVAEFEPMTMRFGTTSGESTMYVQYFKKFAEKVSAATDGAVTI